MKIALITDNYLPTLGGVSNVMINIQRNLNLLGEKVLVFNNTYNNPTEQCFKILSSGKNIKSLKSQGIAFYLFIIRLYLKIIFSFKGIRMRNKLNFGFYYCFYPKNIINRIISIKNLVSHFKNEKIDVILSGTSSYPLLYSFILSKWFKIPLATIAHGDDFILQFPLKINNSIFQHIETIIVTNRIMKRLFKKIHNIDDSKINIINLGIDENKLELKETKLELRNNLNISPKSFIILTVSRLYPRKGFQTVLESLRLIINTKKDIPIKYIIIGSGEELNAIKVSISNLNLENYVELLGTVDDNVRNKYYKLSDLFVLIPEVKEESIEGFGIVYLEANYFKIPVIGSSTGGVRVAILNEKNGLLVSPGDVNDLKEKILFLYDNEKTRKEMGEFGFKRTLESFNWKNNILIYQKLLKRLIKK